MRGKINWKVHLEDLSRFFYNAAILPTVYLTLDPLWKLSENCESVNGAFGDTAIKGILTTVAMLSLAVWFKHLSDKEDA